MLIIIAVIIVIAVAAGVLGLMTLQRPTAPSEFKLGVILDYSGVFAPCAKAEEIGIRLAVDEINSKGGLWGRVPIRLIIKDGESKPETQLIRYRELAEVDKVDFATGTCHAGGSANIMADSLKVGVPFWPSPVMAWEAFKNDTRAPWTFSAYPSTWGIGYAVCTFIVRDLGLEKIYLLARSDAWGWGQRDGCKAALEKLGKGRIAYYDEFTLGTPDFTPFITKMLASDADIIYTTTFGGDQVTFLKQARELGLSKAKKIITFTNHLTLKGIPPEALEGIYGVLYTYHDIPEGLVDPETYRLNREFTMKVMNATGEPPDPYTFVNYLQVKVIAAAIEKLGKTKVTDPREFERAVLSLEPMKTAKGTFKFDVTGLPIFEYAMFLGVGKSPAEKKDPYDYFKIISVLKDGASILPPKQVLGYTS